MNFANRPTKDWALVSPTPCNYATDGEVEATWIYSHWHCPHQWDKHQEVLRHTDTDVHPSFCPTPPRQLASSCTHLRSILGPYFSLCNYPFTANYYSQILLRGAKVKPDWLIFFFFLIFSFTVFTNPSLCPETDFTSDHLFLNCDEIFLLTLRYYISEIGIKYLYYLILSWDQRLLWWMPGNIFIH